MIVATIRVTVQVQSWLSYPRKVAESLERIAGRTREVDDYVGQIASASDEQARGIHQVTLAMTEMDKVTQANAGSAEESASASGELSNEARSMKEAVHTFQALIGGNSGTASSTARQWAASAARPGTTARARTPAATGATRTAVLMPGPRPKSPAGPAVRQVL